MPWVCNMDFFLASISQALIRDITDKLINVSGNNRTSEIFFSVLNR